MGWFDDNQDNAQQVYGDDGPHEGKFSHEVIAGAAAFAGFKAFEDHQRKEGKQVNHAFAKELLAGFAGAEVDKLAETKGMDFKDREEAKYRAKQESERAYEEHYERGHGADQYDPDRYGPPEHIERWGN